MESGKSIIQGIEVKLDLVDAMVAAADPNESDEDVREMEISACPTCGSCSGMFTANSMNCLTEALGLALPGNGSLLATHADRKELFLEAARTIVNLTKRYYEQDDETALPRSIANFEAFQNAMSLDICMGGSTNTVYCICWRQRMKARLALIWITLTSYLAYHSKPQQSRTCYTALSYGRCSQSRWRYGVIG